MAEGKFSFWAAGNICYAAVQAKVRDDEAMILARFKHRAQQVAEAWKGNECKTVFTFEERG